MSKAHVQLLALFLCILSGSWAATAVDSPAGCRSAVTRTPEDWGVLIDATWGPGLPAAEQLALFDQVFQLVDSGYGAFHNLDIDLDAIRSRYRPEIAGGVSRGRLAAIMNHISLALSDCHTYIVDREVSWGTYAAPGVPLLVVGAWVANYRFGASLTVLPDDTLLVIRALPDQPLGLQPGDIVLGYDGVLWSQLYPQLLEAELPIQFVWLWGSTDQSMHHCMMMSAGLNWHLFDTIDVLRYATGETVHLSTEPLWYHEKLVLGNEQLPVAGVAMPNFEDDFVSWGIVEGTEVGYVYVSSWSMDPVDRIRVEFYEAIRALMDDHDTEGLILDFRLNTGGGAAVPNSGFSMLFDSDVYTIAYELRANGSADHLQMLPHWFLTPEYLKIQATPSSYYDRPIAVLIGPGTVSAGDISAQRLLSHPMVRTFGKPSNGGFTITDNPYIGERWWFSRANGSAYTVSGHRHLAHTGVGADFEVWLTPEDVVQGRDTVVEAAIDWIQRSHPRHPGDRAAPQ